MNEQLNIKGRIKIDLYKTDAYNNEWLVKEGDWIENIITNAGKASLASLLNSANEGQGIVTHIGFGTGTTAPAATDTTLNTEIAVAEYSRQPVQRSNPSSNVIQYVVNLTGLTTEIVVSEAGLFSDAVGGVLFAHQLIGAVTLSTPEDNLQITWQVIFS